MVLDRGSWLLSSLSLWLLVDEEVMIASLPFYITKVNEKLVREEVLGD